ncbi:AEC family transporter [Otariodibacter oris]|uniref:Malonate transporter n=1 Tax=Otariodibacter oris TaxID=1032623 RepID=A0A420XET2_9PAST|nr:AEC family transporter [Otariodibacter oris]QGM81381.1 transporter [Otariodibacter oris]RKR70806.1 malonate transporter [Otariodibacter oris]
MFDTIISALLPIYVGIALGFFAGKRGIVDNQNVKSINMMLMTFMVPLTMFIAIARTPRDLILPNLPLILVIGSSMLVMFFGTLFIQRKFFGFGLTDGVVQALIVAFPNFASLGIPLLLPLYGDQAALLAATGIVSGSIFVTPIALSLLRMGSAIDSGAQVSVGKEFLKALSGAVRTPVFFFPILGLIWSVLGLQMPSFVPTLFGPITLATGGVGLFITGLLLSAQKIQLNVNVTLSAILANVVQPLVGLGIGLLLGIEYTTAARAAILMAIPSAFFGLVFGALVNSRPAVAGATLLLSSIGGILTLAVFLGWLV